VSTLELFVHTIAHTGGLILLFGVTNCRNTDRAPATDPSIDHPLLVGVPIPLERATWRIWAGEVYLLNRAYADHLRRAGLVPIFLPVGEGGLEAARIVAGLDGLLIAGGADVDPGWFEHEPHPSAGPFDTDRDAFELSLIREALDRGIPIFGICRGMQLLNVALGGTLTQHLPDVVGTDVHNPILGEFALHRVTFAPDTGLGDALGSAMDVPTYHHQAVDAVAPRLRPVAWADDGTVEAAEDTEGRLLAVQWHPEMVASNAIFEQFALMCRRTTRAMPSPQPAQRTYPRTKHT
jgi:putative glutamine amidotransferase